MKLTKKIFFGIIFSAIIGRFIYVENNQLEKSYYNYETYKISKEFDGYKIVQISDLHNKLFGKNNKKLLETIDEENPDIVVITGDVYYSYRHKIGHSLKFLKELAKKHKVYFVTGNHEYRDKMWKKHSEIIKSYGIDIIDNETRKIYKNKDFIQIYGLKDPAFYIKPIRYTIFEKKLRKIQESIDKNKLGILLSHRPDKMDIYSRNNVDLVFTGHAHGGQVRLFGHGILSPSEGFFPKYTSGKYKEKNTTMIISRGLGRTIFTIRLFNRPNVVVTTLNAISSDNII